MTDDLAGPKAILVADDDPDILNIVASVLEIAGYTVLRSADGTAAAAQLAHCLPDLAILDLTMPGKGGNELCSMIRAMPGGDSVAVMILTARDGIQDKITALDGGADEYVTKPFNHTELLARVRALLRVRTLNLMLAKKNLELEQMQALLVQQERALAVNQLAGTAAHRLGQPLAAIVLNIHLVENLPPDDERYKKALAAIKQDTKRMTELIEKLRGADAARTAEYFGKTAILDIEEPKK